MYVGCNRHGIGPTQIQTITASCPHWAHTGAHRESFHSCKIQAFSPFSNNAAVVEILRANIEGVCLQELRSYDRFCLPLLLSESEQEHEQPQSPHNCHASQQCHVCLMIYPQGGQAKFIHVYPFHCKRYELCKHRRAVVCLECHTIAPN